jgi:predicted nucleotidyltransferase
LKKITNDTGRHFMPCYKIVNSFLEEEVGIKELLSEHRSAIQQIAAKHGAYDIRFINSVVRGEEGGAKDIVFLVKTRERISPWFPRGLVADLEEMLGHSVEIVAEKGLNPHAREELLKKAIPI